MSRQLYDYLADAYRQRNGTPTVNGPLDERIYVDDYDEDRDSEDVFCKVWLRITGKDTFDLHLTRAPANGVLQEWIEEAGGTTTADITGTTIVISLTVNATMFLRDWAKLTERLKNYKRNGRYEDPNWYWKCPRVAASLDSLATHLWQFRSDRRHGRLTKSKRRPKEPPKVLRR